MSSAFIAATGRALDEMTHADLIELDLVAIMIDGWLSVRVSAAA